MNREKNILIFSWVLTSILLLVLVPRKKVKDAHVIFLFVQAITWLFGAIVVKKKLLRYPYREFKDVTKTSFTFEYFVYPASCVLFNLYYPINKPLRIKVYYSVIFTSAISYLEALIEKYTNLLKYNSWKWYWSWISMLATFFLSRKYYLWFFNNKGNMYSTYQKQ